MSGRLTQSVPPPVRARATGTDFVSSFTELSQRIRSEGLLERRRGCYLVRIAATVGAFVLTWVCVAIIGDTWWQLTAAAALALISAQFGFLGHDGAHRQMFASARANEWTARVLSGAFAGLSYGWWMSKHNKHHNAPNQIDKDPDIGPGPLAFVPDTARGRTGWAARFTRNQGWLFFPLLSFEGLMLHYSSMSTLLTSPATKRRGTELTLVLTRLSAGIAAPLLLMPAGKAAVFIAVQLALFGIILGAAFAPNHKGMPLVPASMKVDFLRRQVLMSRNITGGAVTDFMMGGLNYQIEHRLFPNMPRFNLKRAQPIVQEHCARHGVAYTQTSLVQSYSIVVRYLNRVGLGDRDPFSCPMVRLYRP